MTGSPTFQRISQETLEKYEKLNKLLQDMDNPLFDKMMEKVAGHHHIKALIGKRECV